MAQIGLVPLAIFLLKDKIEEGAKLPTVAMVMNETNYFLPVLPNETVRVISKKEYFRFGKLKCQVAMRNAKDELVCKGTIAGMVARKQIKEIGKNE